MILLLFRKYYYTVLVYYIKQVRTLLLLHLLTLQYNCMYF